MVKKISFKEIINDDISVDKLHINTACLPSCAEQFSPEFSPDTDSNCWLSGWRVNRDTESFSPRQHREVLSLLEGELCQQSLVTSLAGRDPHLANTFSLDQSELCAGAGPDQVS